MPSLTKTKTKLELYREHIREWRECQRCELADQRSRVVFARGNLDAEVLLIGESPGESEDSIGMPFVGPAGHLLDVILDQSLNGKPYVIYNVVGCLPKKAKTTDDHKPSPEAIAACRSRLEEFLDIVKEKLKLIVLIGATAKKVTCAEIKTIGILHPAAMLRMDESRKRFEFQQAVVTIRTALLMLGEN